MLVALSGGADSAATLAALASLAVRLKIRVSAAHIHHGLRGAEADADALTARSLADRFGVPFHVARLPASLRRGGNLEERAREARYRKLAAIAHGCGATCVATGHTCDDQAETVLLRIIRGCGPSGLTAIMPMARIDSACVIRPMLNCTRAEVEEFVAALELPWCRDSSNGDRRFLRNRVRLEVLPLLRELNPRIDGALANLASASQEREASSFDGVRTPEATLPVSIVTAKPAPQRAEAIRRWLAAVRGSRRGLSRRHVLSVLSLVRGARPSRRIDLPGGAVLREYDNLRFVTGADPPRAALSPISIRPGQRTRVNGWEIQAEPIKPRGAASNLPLDLWAAVVDADAVASGLLVRNAVPGDRVQPYGMNGRRKLSDIFVDRKVPRALRGLCPVVQAGADVLWVPGVVRSRKGLVGAQTKRVLWLRAKSVPKPLLG